MDGKRKPKWVKTGLPYEERYEAKAKKILAKTLFDLTNAQVEAQAEQVRNKEPNTPQEIAEALPFIDWMYRWLESTKPPRIREMTYQSYKQMVDTRIKKYFEPLGLTLAEIRAEHIDKFYGTILADGCKTNTVIHYHAVIRKALQQAWKYDYIPCNPADKVEKPKKNKFVGQTYEPQEVITLLCATAGDPLNICMWLGAFYGLRRSEALGLRWSAIDFEQNVIRINHQVIELKIDGVYTTVARDSVKTDASEAELPLMPIVKERLLAERKRQELNRALFQDNYNTDWLDYVCVDERGTVLRPNYVSEHFAWVLKKYGLRHIRFHDLRHTCASLLINAKQPLKHVQAWMRHSDIGTTGNTYAHLFKDAMDDNAAILGGVMTGAPFPLLIPNEKSA